MTRKPLPESVPANISRGELLAILRESMSRELYRVVERMVDHRGSDNQSALERG